MGRSIIENTMSDTADRISDSGDKNNDTTDHQRRRQLLATTSGQAGPSHSLPASAGYFIEQVQQNSSRHIPLCFGGFRSDYSGPDPGHDGGH